MFLALGRCRSSNALNAIEMLLEGYKVEPETESSLKPLLPAITACFGANLSIVDTVDALKRHQASDDSGGRHTLMHKIKTPFSLYQPGELFSRMQDCDQNN